MASQNFQPIILAAGRGTRFPDIVNQKPKCLLPIGPHPMLWYPLNMLQSHGFNETIVIVLEVQKLEVQLTMEKYSLKMKIDYFGLPSDQDFGTADSLKLIKDKIRPNNDVLVVSCDIITDIKLYPMLSIFHQHDATLVVQLFHNNRLGGVTVPGQKSKHKPDRDLIGIHPETHRLILLASSSDYEENLVLSLHRLRKNGRINIFSNLIDSHIYIMKRWVLDYLCDDDPNKPNSNFSTVKGELLPYIVKKQLARTETNVVGDKLTSEANVNTKARDIYQYVTSSKMRQKIIETSVYNDTLSRGAYNSDLIRCYAVTASKDSFGIRANSMMGYCIANKHATNILESIQMGGVKQFISASATIKSTQFSNCSVGDNTTISERTSIHNTIFGSNCKISEKTRISDSILMHNVVIEDCVVLENCIVCDKAVIKQGSNLKNCLIGSNFTVEEKTVKEKAHLTSDDDLMEIE